MKDEFDRYFETHRSALDADEPNRDLLWEGMHTQMVRRQYLRKLRIWQLAASLALLLGLGHIGWERLHPAGELAATAPAPGDTQPASVPGGLSALEMNYQQQLQQLQVQVNVQNIDPAQHQVFYEELDYIEQVEQDAREEIPLVSDKERLTLILVDTYEKKIRLLEKLLLQIERNEHSEREMEKTKSHEDTQHI